MNKKQRHTPEEVKRYNKSYIEFMKAPKEKPDGEENKFRMPALPLLTLNGVQKKPDKEISVSELKTITKEVKHHE